MILPQSSCGPCADITKRFEQQVARHTFGNLRIKHKLPTRRPKERPTSIPIYARDGSLTNQFIPISEHPAPAFMFKCLPAGILIDAPPELDRMPYWEMVGTAASDSDLKAFNEKYGSNAVYRYKHIPDQFARTLAKIAYGYAIAILGAETFEPFIQDVILGNSPNISYLVGGSSDIEPPVPNAGHLLGIIVRGPRNALLVVVTIRLFASTHTPSYHVVVGRITHQSGFDVVMRMDEDRQRQEAAYERSNP